MPKDDSAVPGRAPLEAIVRAIGKKTIAEKMHLYEKSRVDGERVIDAWLKGGNVDPARAWVFGEAVGADAEGYPRDASVSGLLALYWFGHLTDVVGVLGCCDRGAIAKHANRLDAMLHEMAGTAHVSPFDGRVTPDHPIFGSMHVAPATLRQAAEFVGNGTSFASANFASEARALEDRYAARALWTMPEELAACITEGARLWFQTWESGVRTRRDARARAIVVPRLISVYATAEKPIAYAEKTRLVVEGLGIWLTEVLHQQRPSGKPPPHRP